MNLWIPFYKLKKKKSQKNFFTYVLKNSLMTGAEDDSLRLTALIFLLFQKEI